jgi:low affinity Fe/Cu permease
MVFLIQNTQNRDTREIHLKLDELIGPDKNARNDFIELERLSDIELAEFLRLPGRSDQLYGNRRAAERRAVVRHNPAAS